MSMRCPKCNGTAQVKGSFEDVERYEKYRFYRCVDCGDVFYTTEMIDDYAKEDFIRLQRIDRKEKARAYRARLKQRREGETDEQVD